MVQALQADATEHRKDSPKVKVIRINVDENKAMSQLLNIKYLPTVYLYKNKRAVWNFTGYLDRYPLQVYVSRHFED